MRDRDRNLRIYVYEDGSIGVTASEGLLNYGVGKHHTKLISETTSIHQIDIPDGTDNELPEMVDVTDLLLGPPDYERLVEAQDAGKVVRDPDGDRAHLYEFRDGFAFGRYQSASTGTWCANSWTASELVKFKIEEEE